MIETSGHPGSYAGRTPLESDPLTPKIIAVSTGYSNETGLSLVVDARRAVGARAAGLRYPQRMLPILLFEVGRKLTWLGVVALPLWSDGNLTGATREQTAAVLWVAIIIAVILWRHVVRQFVIARGEQWH